MKPTLPSVAAVTPFEQEAHDRTVLVAEVRGAQEVLGPIDPAFLRRRSEAKEHDRDVRIW